MKEKYKSIYNAARAYRQKEENAKKPSDYDFGVDDEYIKSFYDDLKSYKDDAEKEYNSIDYGSDVSRLYDKHSSTTSSLRDRSSNIRAYLNANKKNINEESYTKLIEDLDSFDPFLNDTSKAFKDAKDFYSTFTTKYDYDSYVLNNVGGVDSKSIETRKNAYNSVSARLAEIAKEIADTGYESKTTYEMSASGLLVPVNNASKATTDKYNSLVDEKERLEAELRKYESGKKDTDDLYTEYSAKEDWAEDSKNRNFGKVSYDSNKSTLIGTTIEDPLGTYLQASDSDIYRAIDAGYDPKADPIYNDYNKVLSDGDLGGWEHLYDSEKDLYYYMLSNGLKDEALAYLKGMETELDRRATEKMQGYLENASPLELVFHNVVSVPANIVGGAVSFVGNALSMANGEEINPYQYGYMQNYGQGVRTATANDINAATGASNSDWLTWGDAYQGLMSGIDSAVGAATFGSGYTVLMGMGAASSEAKELYEKGASKGQIIGGSLLAGAAEAIFEKASVGYFLDDVLGKPSKHIGQWALKTLGQAGVEASEELATTIANYISDAVVRGGASDWATIIDNYKKQGYTDGQAIWQAVKQVGGEALHDAAVGAISGGMMGGVGGAATSLAYNAQRSYDLQRQGQQLIDVGGVDAVKELGVQYANEIGGAKGNKLAKSANAITADSNAKDVGAFQERVQNARKKLNKADIKTALIEKGVSKAKAENYANVLVAMNEQYFNGNDHVFNLGTDEQWQKMTGDKNAYSVLSEIVTNMDSSVNKRNQGATEKYNNVVTEYVTNQVKEAKAKATMENHFDVSADGKTINTKTNADVNVVEIASIKDGEMTLKLDNGETINAKDVSFPTEAEGLLYSAVLDMGVNAAVANSIVKNYDPDAGISAHRYALGVQEAYQYGRHNIPMQEMSGKAFSADLTEAQRTHAYNLGKSDAKTSVEAKQNAIDEAKKNDGTKSAKKGKVYFEGNRSTITALQKTSLDTLDKLAEALGVSFYIYESRVENGKRVYTAEDGTVKPAPNGMYKTSDGSIHIDLNAGIDGEGTILFTAAHELTHYIKQWSPAKFKVLADFLMEQYGKKGVYVDTLVKQQIAKAKRNGRSITYDTAFEEVVADSMETMLADGNVAEKLALLKQQDEGLWNKIKQFFAELAKKIREVYAGLDPNSQEGKYVAEMKDAIERMQELFTEALVDASENYNSIGIRNLNDFAEAKTTDGETLFQYRAMEADESVYREMLKTANIMTDAEIDNLFETINGAMDIIKENLEVLDYAWDADINDRAFNPVKPNSDSLYQVSVDFSTLCRKRLLQQTIQVHLQEALNKPLTREEGIAIRDALMAIQEEGRQIEIACALCYVESARMKSPAQIKKFLNNRESVIKDFFASKSDDVKAEMKKAEMDAREKLGVGNKSLKSLPGKTAKAIRDAKKAVKANYTPTAEEQAIIETAKEMSVTDFTSPEGLENLAKNHKDLFDAYTSYIRNATKSKGIEADTWWRAGDSASISDTLIANMNAENGLRSQSWSDFQVIHLLDYIAATIELSTRKAKMQVYSKVADYVELMGNTGQMINISLIPGREFTGSLDYDSTEGMEYKRALELRNKYHATAGTICIGINNTQIQMLLADGNIDYVIPYHRSGMAKTIRKAMHIPTWDEYENYQSESELDRKPAEKQAEKYGVKLLDESDSNYHKHPSFSEWFDVKVAKQIAKMENANPSNKAAQKKYCVMYGGYMAMQNAADTYLKLCAERGIAPKFSNENANFTAEDNYWKLLIDRKMVDNVTGEIIEQQAVKPVFDQAEVLRILNDELERYPGVKADQEYATRKVVQGFLSGSIKGGMSSQAIANAMKTPVDNVTKTSILAAESDGVLHSDRITADMSDAERYELLKNRKITLAAFNDAEYRKVMSENPMLLDKKLKENDAKKLLKKIGAEFGAFNKYSNSDVEIEFEFGKNNMDESLHKQNGNYDVYAQMLSCFSDVITNAVGIEIHNRNNEGYKTDRTLKNVYVLCSAFENDTDIIPVKLEIKEFYDKPNRLYVAVALEGIKKDRVKSMGVPNNRSHIRTSPVAISIHDLLSNVNPIDVDFLKYIPKGFLNEEQILYSDRVSNSELASMDETALYIKNTDKANYIGMIFNGTKTEETRSKRTLDAFIGKEFYVTDGEKVYGSIVLGEPHQYTAEEFHKAENQKKHRVPKGDKYDIKQGGTKWSYPIESYTKFDKPKKLSESKEYKNSFQAREVLYSDRDSSGRTLTKAQQEFFKDSKVRDADGNLLVVYHGGMVGNVFDTNRGGDGTTAFGNGAYFTDSKYYAEDYSDSKGGEVKAYYLNIEKIFDNEKDSHDDEPNWAGVVGQLKQIGFTDAEIKRVNAWGFDVLKKLLEDKGFTAKPRQKNPQWDTLSDMQKRYNSQYLPIGIFGNSEAANTILRRAGYDGIVATFNDAKQYVAFYPEEAKLTTNSNPTEDPDVRYQDRDTSAVSNRSLLANALESTIDTSTQAGQNELQKLNEYKGMVNTLDEWNAKLTELRAQIKQEAFTKGGDRSKVKKLQDEATKLANRISIYDKKLLTLEASKPLKSVLDREKVKAAQRQKQKDDEVLKAYRDRAESKLKKQAEHYQESRKNAVEGRRKTAMKQNIKKVVNRLNSLLKNGTKERNVKNGLRDTVASALAAAETLFDSNITNDEIVRNGIDFATEEDSIRLNRYRDLLEQRDTIIGQIDAITTARGVSGTSDKTEALYAQIDRIDAELATLSKELSKVFEMERARINRATVSSAIDSIATAYKSIRDSKDEYIKNAYDEYVAMRLDALKESIGGTLVRDMTLDQLTELYDAFKAVAHTVANANTYFRKGKAEDLAKLVNTVQSQIMSHHKEQENDPRAGAKKPIDFGKEFLWNEMKPVTAFEALGSDAYTELFWDAIEAEGKWAKFMEEAKGFLDKQRNTYGYKSWDMDSVHEFSLLHGKKFKLTLQDMMSIYAYSKREQAEEHMTAGGFQFDDRSEYKDKDGTKRVHLTGELYATDWTTINQIVGKLGKLYDGKVIQYVDAVQEYLTSLGSKGNEVSNILYGIDIFNEKAYFPLMSAKDYINSVQEALNNTPTQVSLKNTGMTKQTVPHAKNPIILQGFDSVVEGHIKKMADYCTQVLPIENLRRVFDSVSLADYGDSVATKAIIKKVYGEAAEKYFDQYITDLNGGTFVSGAESPTMKMFSKFKGTAVAASLSVIIQQPFAVTRAMAMISPKHFILGKIAKPEGMKLYEEIKKYAPVAVIKEMGGFDVGSGRTAKDYLGTRTDKGFKRVVDEVNEKAMIGAQKADELGWGIIWKAVKKEVMSQGKFKYGTDEFYEACGKRFTEVIVNTQVYDSVNSRSGYMRSKSELVKFATSFMGEPTTVVNMAVSAALKVQRAVNKAERKKAMANLRRTAGTLVASTVLTTVAKSLIYAMRDDDDEEGFLERWASKTGSNLLSDLNPFTLLPYTRDIVSLLEGWDVERPDMTLFANIITSAKKMIKDGATAEEILTFVGDVANVFGVPAKNLIRDTKAIINLLSDILSGNI